MIKVIKHNAHLFLTAIMFLTRIPVPKNLPHSYTHLQGSARYFSWVGICIGAAAAIAFFLTHLFFSTALAIILSMITTLLITGAFHEDGLADCFDAFGGGWSKEQILTIMKDSRLGTYGVIGIVGALSLKYIILFDLAIKVPALQITFIFITAHAFSRMMAVTVMQQLSYVQDIDISKSKPLANQKLRTGEIIVVTLGAAIPLATFLFYLSPQPLLINPSSIIKIPYRLCLLLAPAFLLRYVAVRFFKKWIGGYTGDCLGATQQICEIGFYIGCLLLWKSI
ncbi:MAG: adenosylcobinamide-GDP ribazoletransferase [Chitinophagaceae bacterium]|jgi:adenosylcobinamide-GDP ribazoletransferase|nr:adenosylcobinamide-GDP ribazoletransferase [Chitinophagaceae bacterium]